MIEVKQPSASPLAQEPHGPLHHAYFVACVHCAKVSDLLTVTRPYVQGQLSAAGWEYVPWHGWLCQPCYAQKLYPIEPVSSRRHARTGERRCIGCGISLEGAHDARKRCQKCADTWKRNYGAIYAAAVRQGKIIPKKRKKRRA